jgi:hypothetical protein
VDERQRRWVRRFDWIILVAAALVIPVVIIEQADPNDTLKTVAGIANWIGVLTMLIAAAAERFVAQDVDQVQETLERDVEQSEADLLREIREISERLQRLEAGVRRM